MKKRYLALLLSALILIALFTACAKKDAIVEDAPEGSSKTSDKETAKPEPEQSPEEEAPAVTLTVAGSWADCRAIDEAAAAFNAEYPNCTIVYEYLQDYYASLEKRMGGEAPVDIFFTTNIQEGNVLQQYALDLNSAEGLDLSSTFGGLIENFIYREEGDGPQKLYAIPLGAEMRGMYVNVTLLNSLGLDVPTDKESFLEACRVLKENGYIPCHGNPGDFAQTLMYPWICSMIANAEDPEAAWEKVNSRQSGISELFREPMEFLYGLVENGYYDYKTAQTELNLFNETTDQDYCRYFFNIVSKDEGVTYEKADDIGQIAFMPSPMSRLSSLEKAREDYHSEIEFEFILSPIGEEGGYAYMSPAHGIAVNKTSPQLEWAVRFMDFLFKPENNEAFCETFNAVPNTTEAFDYIAALFDVPDDHISHLGQMTFDYGFYDRICAAMVDCSKANNPKYMKDDGAGNLSLYPLDYFMEDLENKLLAE